MGETISNSQVFWLGFLSQKFLYLHFVGNEGLYSVGKEWEKSLSKKQQAVSFVGHSQLSLSHGLVASQVAKTTSS